MSQADEPARLNRSVDWLGRTVALPRARMTVVAIPGLITIATGVVLSVFGGGYSVTAWYTAGLFLLALLALVIAAEGPRGPRCAPLIWWMLGLYAAFVAFNYLSILWARTPADAWDGANRSLVFGLALAIVATRPWPRPAGLAALGLAGFGVLAVAVGTLTAGALSDPLSQFVDGRLSEPTGYANAVACLCLLGLFPLLYLAAARVAQWPVRALALGGCTVLVQIALLSQSRGGAIALALAALLYLVLVPQRWTSLLCLAVIGVLTALCFGTLTDLIDIGGAVRFEEKLAEARLAIALSAAAAAVLGAVIALAGRRLARPRPALRRAGNWGLAALSIAILAIALLAIGNPARWAERRWDDFRYSGYTKVDRGANRFGGSLGSNRYDFYRVALDEFGRHPVAGIGSENFLVPYLEHRRSSEAPHYPHSFLFSLLSQLGLIGTTIFAAFLVFALAAVRRALSRAGPLDAGITVAALAAFVVWFIQGLVDWMWPFSGLGVIAFALLAVSMRSAEGPPVAIPELADRPRRALSLRGVAVATVTLAMAVSLALPGISSRYLSSAYEAYAAGSVDLALERLDRAAELNFLSAEPLIAKGVIARRSGKPAVAAEAFAESIEREPENWLARLEIGMSLGKSGKRAAAERQLLVAYRLNPLQPLVRQVLQRVRAGKPIKPMEVEQELSNQLTSKLTPLS